MRWGTAGPPRCIPPCTLDATLCAPGLDHFKLYQPAKAKQISMCTGSNLAKLLQHSTKDDIECMIYIVFFWFEWLTEWFIAWLIDWSLCHCLMPQAVTSSRYKRNQILNSAQSELKRLQKANWLDLAMMLYDAIWLLHPKMLKLSTEVSNRGTSPPFSGHWSRWTLDAPWGTWGTALCFPSPTSEHHQFNTIIKYD